MRLIDADYFIRWIDVGHFRQPTELVYSEIDVANMINHFPTAYDVDAVVRELENERFVFYAKDDDEAKGYNDGLNEAIRIVKRGGRNEID